MAEEQRRLEAAQKRIYGLLVEPTASWWESSSIDESTGDDFKPEINMTKAGVDTVDKLCATYSVARKCNR